MTRRLLEEGGQFREPARSEAEKEDIHASLIRLRT